MCNVLAPARSHLFDTNTKNLFFDSTGAKRLSERAFGVSLLCLCLSGSRTREASLAFLVGRSSLFFDLKP